MRSDPGRRGRKRKSKTAASEKITLFGFDLVGRPLIQLPDEDEDNALSFRRHRSGSGSTATTTLTTQTFDSDAAPLDISAIQDISVPKATEAAQTEVKRLKE